MPPQLNYASFWQPNPTRSRPMTIHDKSSIEVRLWTHAYLPGWSGDWRALLIHKTKRGGCPIFGIYANAIECTFVVVGWFIASSCVSHDESQWFRISWRLFRSTISVCQRKEKTWLFFHALLLCSGVFHWKKRMCKLKLQVQSSEMMWVVRLV